MTKEQLLFEDLRLYLQEPKENDPFNSIRLNVLERVHERIEELREEKIRKYGSCVYDNSIE